MATADWQDLGAVETLSARPVSAVTVGRLRLAVSHHDGTFGVVHGSCSHAGGPLGEGALDGEYVTCPWHHWKYHRCTGKGEPGYEDDAVPSYPVRVRDGRVEADLANGTKRSRRPHEPHPLARPIERTAGPPRVLGLSTTNMEVGHERYSTSEALLAHGLTFARERLGAESQLLKLRDLSFRACEGFYSKSAQACTWPCSITQMDPDDQLDRVYEAVVHWADVVLVATPIRWGNASALYYRMIERFNCIQNQVTIANRVLLRNKVGAFLITGGQDNVQQVAGHLLSFFSEIGFHFPQFPFVAHSRGWTAEDMENNVREVQQSDELREGTEQLVARAVDHALLLLDHQDAPHLTSRGGRKAHRLARDPA
jgi:nitrite reductase/ring-hydroxylating ferredoxin subunit/multimeric flavodoxin WrbA